MTRDEVVISEATAAAAALTELHAAAAGGDEAPVQLLRYAKKAYAALHETQAAYHSFPGAAFALDTRQLAGVLGGNADPRDALSLIANAAADSRDSGQPGWSKAGVKALLVERQVCCGERGSWHEGRDF